jgi:hypothetical protein
VEDRTTAPGTARLHMVAELPLKEGIRHGRAGLSVWTLCPTS